MALGPHPGFGLFGKAHREFFAATTDDGWTAVPGYDGAFEKILSGTLDPAGRSGCVTRLVRWRAGTIVPRVLAHAWCEEVFLLEGDLHVGAPGAPETVRLDPGTYACRPAQAPHGPFFTETGCLMLEFSYVPPPSPDQESRS